MVLGVSTDDLTAQEKFTEKEHLNFPLLADHDKKVARAYGVLSPNGFARRATFVIDKKGVVRKVYPDAKAASNFDDVLDYIKKNLAEK